MNFASDNWAGAHPLIAAGLTAHAAGFDAAYGNGALDRKVTETFSRLFEREVAVFFVSTGTAANSLSLAACSRPGGVAYCHREAHAREDECGAPEFLTAGVRLQAVEGSLGRMDPSALGAAMESHGSVHTGRPIAVSLTQSTEIGTLYSPDAIREIAGIAKGFGVPLHMDGARFANALVALDASPAGMTWESGVDILSFGGTKNGCWCAEAIVFFDLDRAKEMPFIRKRSAQLFSKSRFVSAQFEAYFKDGLWLETARHANAMAARLAQAVRASGAARLAWEPEANELFAIMPVTMQKRLEEAGAVFYDWPAPHGFSGGIDDDEVLCRFVASFATTPEEVDRLGGLIA